MNYEFLILLLNGSTSLDILLKEIKLPYSCKNVTGCICIFRLKIKLITEFQIKHIIMS